jgi:2-furoyl-CoA dehydrogenase large subunit
VNQIPRLPIESLAAAPDAAAAGHVGKPLQRVEDAALLIGRGSYVDDIGVKPGTLHAAILRSPHAHADILAIDISAALAPRWRCPACAPC